MINESKQFESHEAILPNGVLPFEFLLIRYILTTKICNAQRGAPMMATNDDHFCRPNSQQICCGITWWEKLTDKLHHINKWKNFRVNQPPINWQNFAQFTNPSNKMDGWMGLFTYAFICFWILMSCILWHFHQLILVPCPVLAHQKWKHNIETFGVNSLFALFRIPVFLHLSSFIWHWIIGSFGGNSPKSNVFPLSIIELLTYVFVDLWLNFFTTIGSLCTFFKCSGQKSQCLYFSLEVPPTTKIRLKMGGNWELYL